MDLQGWSLPLSPDGSASLVPPPPWHFSGDVIGIDYRSDPLALAAVLPDGMTPIAEGDATFVFIDWSFASEHDPRTAADPARGQYREAYVVIPVTFGGQRAARVPYIWVDNDLSFARGLIQGDTSQTCPQRTSVEGKRADGAAKGVKHRSFPVIYGHSRSLEIHR